MMRYNDGRNCGSPGTQAAAGPRRDTRSGGNEGSLHTPRVHFREKREMRLELRL